MRVSALCLVALFLAVSARAGDYTYPIFTMGNSKALVGVDSMSSESRDGHVAAWASAVNSSGDWIQVGVMMNAGWKRPCAYLETMLNHKHSLRCILSVDYGQRIAAKVTLGSHGVWYAYLFGMIFGSAHLSGKPVRETSGEFFHATGALYVHSYK